MRKVVRNIMELILKTDKKHIGVPHSIMLN